MQARLILEDGTLFVGKAFGSTRQSSGEVVFNTSVTGYQEALADHSNDGQIVMMTQPLIGNYGISHEGIEAIKPYIQGMVVREAEEIPSNWRGDYTLDHILKKHDIPGISDIDTRMLTRIIREKGTMKGLITTSDLSLEALVEQLKGTVLPNDQVQRVSTKSAYSVPGHKEKIVIIDYGVKNGIVRELVERGCNVVVVPYLTPAEEISALMPDGILLSNGPGNPEDVSGAKEIIVQLLGTCPIFGIGLGHQLLALACGASTVKMKHGHRGGNQPVKDMSTNKCYITTQNHGYIVEVESLKATRLEVTHINNNDQTVAGIKHLEHPAFSVQYQPEASPGPQESSYLFDEFIAMIQQFKLDQSKVPRQAQM